MPKQTGVILKITGKLIILNSFNVFSTTDLQSIE